MLRSFALVFKASVMLFLCPLLAVNAVADKLPEITSVECIEASLSAVKNNLKEGRMPFQRNGKVKGKKNWETLESCHRIHCESKELVEQVRQWGAKNGFDPSNLITELGHGGVEVYYVELRKICAFDSKGINQQAVAIQNYIKTIKGITYSTWCPELKE